jgi:hypothetical protein
MDFLRFEAWLRSIAESRSFPIAILTDGRESNRFLPGEQSDHGERRIYRLDIVDRDVKG